MSTPRRPDVPPQLSVVRWFASTLSSSSPVMQVLVVVALVFIGVAALAFAADRGETSLTSGTSGSSVGSDGSSDGSSDSNVDTSCVTPACQLATVDSGSPTTDGDAGAARYQAALDAFDPYCTDSETQLGDYAVTSQRLLANGGKTETLLEILQHVRSAIPASAPRMPCSDLFASYVILRGGSA